MFSDAVFEGSVAMRFSSICGRDDKLSRCHLDVKICLPTVTWHVYDCQFESYYFWMGLLAHFRLLKQMCFSIILQVEVTGAAFGEKGY